MTTTPFDLDEFRIRRKVLKVFGASFHVFDAQGRIVGFTKQKAFKLKEDIRLYTDESMGTELLTIHARQIIDFSACYDVLDPQSGSKVGALRRKGLKSILRDHWEVLDADDQPIADLLEDSKTMAVVRRFLSNLVPQKFSLTTRDGALQARFVQHFNPFVFKMAVVVEPGATVDRRLLLGVAVLAAAIEGRQQ